MIQLKILGAAAQALQIVAPQGGDPAQATGQALAEGADFAVALGNPAGARPTEPSAPPAPAGAVAQSGPAEIHPDPGQPVTEGSLPSRDADSTSLDAASGDQSDPEAEPPPDDAALFEPRGDAAPVPTVADPAAPSLAMLHFAAQHFGPEAAAEPASAGQAAAALAPDSTPRRLAEPAPRAAQLPAQVPPDPLTQPDLASLPAWPVVAAPEVRPAYPTPDTAPAMAAAPRAGGAAQTRDPAPDGTSAEHRAIPAWPIPAPAAPIPPAPDRSAVAWAEIARPPGNHPGLGAGQPIPKPAPQAAEPASTPGVRPAGQSTAPVPEPSPVPVALGGAKTLVVDAVADRSAPPRIGEALGQPGLAAAPVVTQPARRLEPGKKRMVPVEPDRAWPVDGAGRPIGPDSKMTRRMVARAGDEVGLAVIQRDARPVAKADKGRQALPAIAALPVVAARPVAGDEGLAVPAPGPGAAMPEAAARRSAGWAAARGALADAAWPRPSALTQGQVTFALSSESGAAVSLPLAAPIAQDQEPQIPLWPEPVQRPGPRSHSTLAQPALPQGEVAALPWSGTAQVAHRWPVESAIVVPGRAKPAVQGAPDSARAAEHPSVNRFRLADAQRGEGVALPDKAEAALPEMPIRLRILPAGPEGDGAAAAALPKRPLANLQPAPVLSKRPGQPDVALTAPRAETGAMPRNPTLSSWPGQMAWDKAGPSDHARDGGNRGAISALARPAEPAPHRPLDVAGPDGVTAQGRAIDTFALATSAWPLPQPLPDGSSMTESPPPEARIPALPPRPSQGDVTARVPQPDLPMPPPSLPADTAPLALVLPTEPAIQVLRDSGATPMAAPAPFLAVPHDQPPQPASDVAARAPEPLPRRGKVTDAPEAPPTPAPTALIGPGVSALAALATPPSFRGATAGAIIPSMADPARRVPQVLLPQDRPGATPPARPARGPAMRDGNVAPVPLPPGLPDNGSPQAPRAEQSDPAPRMKPKPAIPAPEALPLVAPPMPTLAPLPFLPGAEGLLPAQTLDPAGPALSPQAAAMVEPAAPRRLGADLLAGARRAEKEERVEILLDPAELGRVRFELQPGHDRIEIVVAVERPETLDLLRRNLDALRAEFREAGFGQASLSFGQWGQGGQSPHLPDPGPSAGIDLGPVDAPLPELPLRSARPGGGLDLRL